VVGEKGINTGKSLGFTGSNNEIVLRVTEIINKKQIPTKITSEQLVEIKQIELILNSSRNVTVTAEINANVNSHEVISVPVGLLGVAALAIAASKLRFPKRTVPTLPVLPAVLETVRVFQVETILPLSSDRLLNDYMGTYRGWLRRLLGTVASNEGVVSEGLDLQAIIQNRVPQINGVCNMRFESEQQRDQIINDLIDRLAYDIRNNLNIFKQNRNTAVRSPRLSDSENRTYDHNVAVEGNRLEIEKIEIAQCRERAIQIINQTIEERRLQNRALGLVRLQSMRRRVSTAFSDNRNVR
jgi:hypothetical protein